ncbi:MFS transporter [Jeotgalibaca ciconiae]|uniref:Glucuronide permease n=1 Tax=Jeotgalibaca ciconiae TaxID=2496265 RepID=A0A3S9HAV4_9LACT|nr:MFS transporter [Jeotgalibaca ciconiae]AZP04510.1 glucuronide permease [Jeotgalibaca ciconiae]
MDSPNLQENKYHKAKQWEIAFFSLNNSATNLYLFAFGFLTYYATGIAGFATLLVGNLLGAARLFDGIIDPTIGIIMDKFNTRWGKFRPLMLFSNIGLVLSFILLFSTHYFSGVLQVAVFLIALVFHKIVYSVQQTVTKAAQPALTNDPSQRPLFSIYDTVFSSIGVFAMGQVIVSNFLAPRHGGEFNQAFFTEFLLGVMIISAVLTTLAIIGIRRKDRTEYFGLGEITVATKSLQDYWSVIKGNTPLITLALCGGLMKFIAQLLSDQAFLVILFGIVLGNYRLSGQLSLWQIIPNLLIVILFTRLATRKDLKASYTVSIVVAMLSTLTMLLILWTSGDTTQIFTNGGFIAILFGVAYVAMKVTATYPSSIVLTMSADISDFETSRSGRFVSGLIGTVFSLTDSIASSLAPIFIGFVVAGIGYKNAYPDASEPLTGNILNGVLILLGIPLVLYFLVFVLIRKYPLNREAMEKVQIAIAEKKREDLYE